MAKLKNSNVTKLKNSQFDTSKAQNMAKFKKILNLTKHKNSKSEKKK